MPLKPSPTVQPRYPGVGAGLVGSLSILVRESYNYIQEAAQNHPPGVGTELRKPLDSGAGLCPERSAVHSDNLGCARWVDHLY